jgi:hypothetical protein
LAQYFATFFATKTQKNHFSSEICQGNVGGISRSIGGKSGGFTLLNVWQYFQRTATPPPERQKHHGNSLDEEETTVDDMTGYEHKV